MSAGSKLEEIHKDLGLVGGQLCYMIIKKKISKVLLGQIRDTLRIVANKIDEVINGRL